MGKRRFAVSCSADASATEASRYDSRGVSAHARGWDRGIEVSARLDQDGSEVFEIWETGGSNDPGRRRLVVTLR